MVDFLSGAVTLSYLLAALYFLRFWRRMFERLFLSFALAFALLAVNQLVLLALDATDERGNYAYLLRVMAFIIILVGIVEKNLFRRGKPRPYDTKPGRLP
jgi:amino acid transporter